MTLGWLQWEDAWTDARLGDGRMIMRSCLDVGCEEEEEDEGRRPRLITLDHLGKERSPLFSYNSHKKEALHPSREHISCPLPPSARM